MGQGGCPGRDTKNVPKGAKLKELNRLEKKLGRGLSCSPAAPRLHLQTAGQRGYQRCWWSVAGDSGKKKKDKAGREGGWWAGSLRFLFSSTDHQERRALAKGRLLAIQVSLTFPSPPKFYLPAYSLMPLQRPNLRNSVALSTSNLYQPEKLKQHHHHKKQTTKPTPKTPNRKICSVTVHLAFLESLQNLISVHGRAEQPQLAANPKVPRQHIHTPGLTRAHLGRHRLS